MKPTSRPVLLISSERGILSKSTVEIGRRTEFEMRCGKNLIVPGYSGQDSASAIGTLRPLSCLSKVAMHPEGGEVLVHPRAGARHHEHGDLAVTPLARRANSTTPGRPGAGFPVDLVARAGTGPEGLAMAR